MFSYKNQSQLRVFFDDFGILETKTHDASFARVESENRSGYIDFAILKSSNRVSWKRSIPDRFARSLSRTFTHTFAARSCLDLHKILASKRLRR